MEYQIVEREQDGYKKFYTAFNDVGDTFEIPCILNEEGEVNTNQTQQKMDQHIAESELLINLL
jgi:hypothetical protein